MKKFLSIVLACLLWVSCGAFLTGCGKVTVKDMKLQAGTIETTILKGGSFSTTNAVVKVTYSNKKTENVTSEKLKFSTIDTNTVGIQTLTITYTYNEKDYKLEQKIKIVETDSELYTIVNLKSDVWTDYEFNRSEKTNTQNNFIDHDQPLTVGTDNYVDLGITASGIDADGNPPVGGIKNVKTNLTVAEKQLDNTYSPVSDYSIYLTIDPLTNIITFKSGAEGKELSLTFKAATSDSVYEEAQTQFTAYVKVEKGFNVYNAQDLSLFDNQKWQEANRDAVREKYGLADDYYPEKMYLLSKIEITKEDLPSHYFYEQHEADDQLHGTANLRAWAEERDTWLKTAQPLAEGEKRDPVAGSTINYYGKGIYHREMTNGQKFSFNGNYFMIDVQQFPLVVYQNKNENGVSQPSHYTSSSNGLPEGPYQSLFFIGNTGNGGYHTLTDGPEDDDRTRAEFTNTQLIGNGELTSDMRKSGGLMMLKDAMVDFYGYNTLANNFTVGYFFHEDAVTKTNPTNGSNHNVYKSEYVVESCKGYGSFESLFYMNNSAHTIIKDSEFKDAGGPALIIDHDNGVAGDIEANNADTSPCVDIVNTTLSSLVNADSPWFKTFTGASTLLGTLQSVGEKLFDNTFEDSLNLPHSTKTILREIGATNGLDKGGKVMDIIALVKANGSNVMGANKVRGYVREFASQEEYDEYYKDGIKNVYGLDFDEPKYTIPTKGTVSLSDYVTGTNPNVGENVGGQNFGDVVMQSTNGGYINFASVVGAQPNADLLVSSVRFGAMVASGISTIIDTLAQTQTTDFANYKNVVNMSANLIERFNTYYTNQEAQLDAFFSALVLLNPSDPSQQQLLGQLRAIYPFGYTQETWNALSGHADLKYQAIYDYLKGIETRNVYATGDYINLYLFNGMGAMLKLYEQPAA